jgi:hypothetical protein
MGEGKLLAAGTAALMLAGAAAAQGPLYRERWADLQLETLRLRVQAESRGRDDATLAAVADLLVAPDHGMASRPAAASPPTTRSSCVRRSASTCCPRSSIRRRAPRPVGRSMSAC